MSAFITLEGGEGAGKSTQARRLAATLTAAGHEVVLTREPGGTDEAELIRGLLLDPARQFAPLADTLLHFAARADHVDKLIRPALRRGAVVVCDRFYDSTMAYQGFGMGMDHAVITALTRLIGLVPDLTLILEVSEDTGKMRLARRGDRADRYELMGAATMARIAAGFHAIATAAPQRCAIISAEAAPDDVAAAIAATVGKRLNLLR